MKAFVAGATGLTGRHIVNQLVQRGIPVRALARNREAAQSVLPPEAEIHVGDVLNPESLRTALAESTVLFCATGARPGLDFTAPYQVDYQGTRNLVTLAKEQQIEHFVLVSSLCVSKLFHPLNLFWLVLWWKKQAESDLQQSGIPYTIVRPGGLRNDDSSDPIVMATADSLFEGSIPRNRVAQVCVEALFQPQARNKIVEIVSRPEASNQSVAELFANVS